jgi:pimeloyl-ACP methyl ester carboxylesterase
MATDIRRYRLRHRSRPIDVLVAGEGRPVTLLHGWGLSGMAYREAIVALAARGFRVAAPGVSVAEGWTIEGVAEITAEAMAAVEVAPAAVVGHSFGGVIGAQLTLDHPDFVTSFVPVDAPLVTLGSVRLGRIMFPGRHYRVAGTRDAALALLRSISMPGGASSLWRSARWFLGNGHAQPLRAIAETELPRTVVWATHDSLLPIGIGTRVAEALACPLVQVGPEEGWPLHRPPDHDWVFRAPGHFATVVERVLRHNARPHAAPGSPYEE